MTHDPPRSVGQLLYGTHAQPVHSLCVRASMPCFALSTAVRVVNTWLRSTCPSSASYPYGTDWSRCFQLLEPPVLAACRLCDEVGLQQWQPPGIYNMADAAARLQQLKHAVGSCSS